MPTEIEWLDLIEGRQAAPEDDLSLTTFLDQHGGGGSGSFRGLGSDAKEYFVKPPNQLQGGYVLASEFVVGQIGQVVGVAVCQSKLITIPADLAGHEFRPGHQLAEGIGHASASVVDAQEVRGVPTRRTDDDNARRHAGLAALFDLCWGADEQYLHAVTDDWRIYSHDHGHYLPGGPTWTADLLRAQVATPHPLGFDVTGLSDEHLDAYATRLDTDLTTNVISAVLRRVPVAWAVPDVDLATLGWFIGERAAPVAQRLRDVKGSLMP
jgi:hypothetical protein